jgi:hypothetical protein
LLVTIKVSIMMSALEAHGDAGRLGRKDRRDGQVQRGAAEIERISGRPTKATMRLGTLIDCIASMALAKPPRKTSLRSDQRRFLTARPNF